MPLFPCRELFLLAYPLLQSDRAKASFAAGPLENLISYHGTEYADLVIELAQKDDDFNYLLGGILNCDSDQPDYVWSKILSVRKNVW